MTLNLNSLIYISCVDDLKIILFIFLDYNISSGRLNPKGRHRHIYMASDSNNSAKAILIIFFNLCARLINLFIYFSFLCIYQTYIMSYCFF